MSGVIEAFDFIDGEWPRADQTHFTAEYVKKLRKFINTKLTEDASDGGDARIIGHLENRSAHLVQRGQFMFALLGVAIHGAKLEHGKRLAVEPAALLGGKNRPW